MYPSAWPLSSPSPGMKYYVFFVGAEGDTPSGHYEWVDGQPVDRLSYVWVFGREESVGVREDVCVCGRPTPWPHPMYEWTEGEGWEAGRMSGWMAIKVTPHITRAQGWRLNYIIGFPKYPSSSIFVALSTRVYVPYDMLCQCTTGRYRINYFTVLSHTAIP